MSDHLANITVRGPQRAEIAALITEVLRTAGIIPVAGPLHDDDAVHQRYRALGQSKEILAEALLPYHYSKAMSSVSIRINPSV